MAASLSYGDLLDLSGRVAQVLQDLGVKPGDRVAAQVEKSAEALLLYLGACGRARSTCRSTRPTPTARSATSSATPSRRCSSAGPSSRRRWELWPRSSGVPHVLTLGEHSDGSLWDAGPGRHRRRCRRAAQQGRPRGLPLHLGHHRPVQGCHAQPRQPRLQRRGLARYLALHRRRPAAARACRSSIPTACSSPPTSP